MVRATERKYVERTSSINGETYIFIHDVAYRSENDPLSKREETVLSWYRMKNLISLEDSVSIGQQIKKNCRKEHPNEINAEPNYEREKQVMKTAFKAAILSEIKEYDSHVKDLFQKIDNA